MRVAGDHNVEPRLRKGLSPTTGQLPTGGSASSAVESRKARSHRAIDHRGGGSARVDLKVARNGGYEERLAAERAETLEEIRLYELRHAEAVSQAELAGRLEVSSNGSARSS
jgi:DNA-binding transcriptional regulator YiaG